MKIHAAQKKIKTKNNQLLFGGKTAQEIVAITGGTPCFIYSQQDIYQRIGELKRDLPEIVKLNYALKSNPFAPLVGQLANWVDGFDVASHKELVLALSSGMPAHKISIAGPGKSRTLLEAAIASGIVINIESENELNLIYKLCTEFSYKANIAIRINPDFELKNSGMKMSGGSKPFGIDAEKVPNLLKSLDFNMVTLKGFHIFTGSQNLNHEALIEAQNKTFDLAYRLLEEQGIKITQLNIGGGFGIPYFPKEQPLQVEPIIENLTKLASHYAPLLGLEEIHLELGRYLVGEAGVYLSKVLDKKDSRGKTYLITDGGMHHHLANSGNLGQVLRKNYPVVLANRVSAPEYEEVNISGPLCTPLDIMAEKVHLPEAHIGDFIAVLQSGAYGPSASPKDFLSQPQVHELMI
jgi:diaminopimelate decarboxylase